jgi:hypothetical protein
MLALLQQKPIVVDVIKQPPATPDISLETALSWFAIAGIFLVAAAIGSLLVAGGTILYKRWKDGTAVDGGSPHTHTRLRI